MVHIVCTVACRNFGMGDTKIRMESKSNKHQRSEFTMSVGKHEAKVRFNMFYRYLVVVVVTSPSGTAYMGWGVGWRDAPK